MARAIGREERTTEQERAKARGRGSNTGEREGCPGAPQNLQEKPLVIKFVFLVLVYITMGRDWHQGKNQTIFSTGPVTKF